MYCHRINNVFSVLNDLSNSKLKLLLFMLYFSTFRILDVDQCNGLFLNRLTVREDFTDCPVLVSIRGLESRKTSLVLFDKKLSW